MKNKLYFTLVLSICCSSSYANDDNNQICDTNPTIQIAATTINENISSDELIIGSTNQSQISMTEQKNWSWGIEFQPVLSVEKGGEHCFSILANTTRLYGEYVRAGFALGLSESFKLNKKPSIPILGRLVFEKCDAEVSPLLGIDAGYSLSTENIDYSSIIINPTLGVRLKNINLGVGYMASIPTKSEIKTSSAINLKIGYTFNSNANISIPQFTNWLRKTYFSVEAGAMTGRDPWTYSESKTILPRISILWNTDVNTAFTASLGFGIMLDSDEVEVAMPIFLRGKYRIGNFSGFRPFVALEGGYRIRIDDCEFKEGLYVEPSVGVEYKNFLLGVGYSKVKYYNKYNIDRNFSPGYLSLKLGYCFH